MLQLQSWLNVLVKLKITPSVADFLRDYIFMFLHRHSKCKVGNAEDINELL